VILGDSHNDSANDSDVDSGIVFDQNRVRIAQNRALL
jgi:hypothetical protein